MTDAEAMVREAGAVAQAAHEAYPTDEQLVAFLRQMQLIRRFEERAAEM